MVPQAIKFYFARFACTLFLMFGIGFSSLYFIHEVALPNIVFDDWAVQWSIFIVCLFFGFIGYGMLGEQRFSNALHNLKKISPNSLSKNIKFQFENLIEFTYSSYFLPSTGKRYRNLSVLQYADYLLSIGEESPRALSYYVQAFIQSPQNSRFRKPLLSILNRGQELSGQEMDLLLIMYQQEKQHDPVFTSYLARLFLRAKQWSGQTEPLFLSALDEKNELSEEIIKFVLPIYLAHRRTDERALSFFVKALKFSVAEEKQIKFILAQSYCEGNLLGVAPDLHKKCEEIFYKLEPSEQEELKSKIDETRIAFKLKKVKLFRKEDLQDLKRLKVEIGLAATKTSLIVKGIIWFGLGLRNSGKWMLLKTLHGAYLFGNLSFKKKFTTFFIFSILIMIGMSFKEVWSPNYGQGKDKFQRSPIASNGSIKGKKGNRVFTVQIAAVNSANQANKLVKKLKRKNIENLYLVKSKRRSGGLWYKLRVGKFSSKNKASEFANQLIASKKVKNYFITAIPTK